jgi:hypothetical protein
VGEGVIHPRARGGSFPDDAEPVSGRRLFTSSPIHFHFGRLIPNNLSLSLSLSLSRSLSPDGVTRGTGGIWNLSATHTPTSPTSQGSTLGKQVAEIVVVLHGGFLFSASPLASRRRRAVGGRGGIPVCPGLAPQPRPRLSPPTWGGGSRRTSCHGRTRHHRQHTSSPPPRTHCVTPAVRASAPSPCPTASASASASRRPTAAGAARGVCGRVGSKKKNYEMCSGALREL